MDKLRYKHNADVKPMQTGRRLGRAYSHRIPLVELKCVSPKRRKEIAARLGGEPGGARGVDSLRYGRFRSLL